MLQMRPDCERCGRDLPADQDGALICSFECSFCAECGEALGKVCPNCGGMLAARPTRVGDALARHPAESQRRFKK